MKRAHYDRVGGLQMPRSRGAMSGFLLVILGAWGALIPFVGPHFNFGYTPDQDWTWTSARGWLEVLPGAVTVVGGLLLIASRNRATAVLGGWLAVVAGAWFVLGGQFAPLLRIGVVGDPIASTDGKRALLEVSYFSGLGLLIVFLGAAVLARLTVRLARDVRRLESTVPATPEAERNLVPASAVPASSVDEPLPDAETKPRNWGFRRHHTGPVTVPANGPFAHSQSRR